MKITNILGASQGLRKFFLISPLLIAFSCSNSNESNLSTYVKIRGFQHGDSVIVSEHYWIMDIENLNDTSFAVYYLNIDTLDYSVFDKNGSEILVDSSERIDTSKVGYVLSNTMLTKDSQNQDDNRYHYCAESSYKIDNKSIVVKAFCKIGDSVGIVYYTDEFGFIAHYAYEWDNIILLSSIGIEETNSEYQELLQAILGDAGFFPVPKRMRDLL
ncbi:MAG: hypothetical protein U9Q67_03285 [Patescibacteria group bacterium]|nr:hypothetical protein [Patescibacteria group bacterium]